MKVAERVHRNQLIRCSEYLRTEQRLSAAWPQHAAALLEPDCGVKQRPSVSGGGDVCGGGGGGGGALSQCRFDEGSLILIRIKKINHHLITRAKTLLYLL